MLAKRVLAASPDRKPTLPKHLVRGWRGRAAQIYCHVQGRPAGPQGPSGSCSVGATCGFGGPKGEEGSLKTVFCPLKCKQTMVNARGHHEKQVPPPQPNGVPLDLPRLPNGCPCLHLHLVDLSKTEEATQVASRDVLVGGQKLRGPFTVMKMIKRQTQAAATCMLGALCDLCAAFEGGCCSRGREPAVVVAQTRFF